jgi:putative methyltransferase (TIGR04325 family)
MGGQWWNLEGAIAQGVCLVKSMESLPAIARDLLPPVLLRALRTLRARQDPAQPVTRMREYSSWQEAERDGTGYEADHILERVSAAAEQVEEGLRTFERDSVLFDEIQHSFPVLAGLLRAAVESQCKLRVLDFGGSLGTSYRQCREFLRPLRALEWNVVEQAHFVERGRDRFSNPELRFFASVEEACAIAAPDVVLASSVLQYLPDAHATLAALRATGSRYVILDRTPMHQGPSDRVILQEVPPGIYPASYPCWIFSRQRLLDSMGPEWQVLAHFESTVDTPMQTEAGPAKIEGYLFRKIGPAGEIADAARSPAG